MNHNNYLCAPKHRWWRGEERIYSALARILEGGIDGHVWDTMFPYHQFFKSSRKNSLNQSSGDQALSLESLYLICGLVGIMFVLATVVFIWETKASHEKTNPWIILKEILEIVVQAVKEILFPCT